MSFLTPAIKEYFENMHPGATIDIWKAKQPLKLIWAGKEYIDQGNYDIEFNNDYTLIKKLTPWPN